MVARFIRFFFARIYDRATVRSFVLSDPVLPLPLSLSLSLSPFYFGSSQKQQQQRVVKKIPCFSGNGIHLKNPRSPANCSIPSYVNNS